MYAYQTKQQKSVDIRPVYGDQPANKIIAALYNSYPQKGEDINGKYIWRAVGHEGHNIICEKWYTILTDLKTVKHVSLECKKVMTPHLTLSERTSSLSVEIYNKGVAYEHDDVGVFKWLAVEPDTDGLILRKHYFTYNI